MSRFFLLLSLSLTSIFLPAQSLFFISPCSPQTFCLNPGSCSEGAVMMVEKAATSCNAGSNINYSYKIDLNNNQSIDIQSTNDTVTGNFAKGTHRVIWKATDNCANIATCEYTFTIKDCLPPTLLCINGLTQNLDGPVCQETFTAGQFILNKFDNCTPANQIQIGMRRAGTGTGFPATDTVTFGQCDAGLNVLEVWAKDAGGLANSYQTYVIVQQVGNECICNPDADITFKGCVHTPANTKIDQYRVKVKTESLPGAPTPILKSANMLVSDSCFAEVKVSGLPFGAGYRSTIRAERTEAPLDGVTTFDLVKISKHILGLDTFTNLYQVIASDVNRSGSVTTFDIVETRKLLLGLYDTFPASPSWRFIRPLANPNNLNGMAAVKDTYQLTLPNLADDITLQGFHFVGIKIGDPNFSASLLPDPEDRNGEALLPLDIRDRWLAAGETAEIPLLLPVEGKMEGWQLALALEPGHLSLESVDGLPADQLNYTSDGLLRAVSYDNIGQKGPDGQLLFTLKVRALQTTRLSEAIGLPTERLQPEAYVTPTENSEAKRCAVQLRFLDASGAQAASACTFFPPRPNPFAEETAFGLVLPAAGPVQLQVFDLSGRLVYESSEWMERGNGSLYLPATALPSGGLYTYRLTANAGTASGKLMRQ